MRIQDYTKSLSRVSRHSAPTSDESGFLFRQNGKQTNANDESGIYPFKIGIKSYFYSWIIKYKIISSNCVLLAVDGIECVENIPRSRPNDAFVIEIDFRFRSVPAKKEK